MWSDDDESAGVVVGRSATGQPLAVSATVDEPARADYEPVTTMVRWRNAVLQPENDEGDEEDTDDIDDDESTWPLVTTMTTIFYSVWVDDSESEENAETMYVKMVVET